MTLCRSTKQRGSAILGQPIVDPGEWTGSQLRSSGRWIHKITKGEVREIERALENFEKTGRDITTITKRNFVLLEFGKTLRKIRKQLFDGLGITLIRGFPVDQFDHKQLAAIFFGIGAHLGRAVSQNAKGHMIGHVKKLTDLDYNTDARERGYRTNVNQRFHSDSCDIVGLMVLQTPMSGGLSRIASTVSVYNHMLKYRPDYVAALSKDSYWDRRNEVPEGKNPWYALPVFNVVNGYFSCRYGRQYIDSTQRFEQVPRMSKTESSALDFFDELLEKLHMQMQFEAGDIQFLYNHVTVHGRTAFEDWADPKLKRHLLRLWLCADGERPLPDVLAERVKGGIITDSTRLHVPLEAC